MLRHVGRQQQPAHRLGQKRHVLQLRHGTASKRHTTTATVEESKQRGCQGTSADSHSRQQELMSKRRNTQTQPQLQMCGLLWSFPVAPAPPPLSHAAVVTQHCHLPHAAPRKLLPPHLGATQSNPTFSQLRVMAAELSSRVNRKGYIRKWRRPSSTGRGRPHVTSCSCWGDRPTSSLICVVGYMGG